MDGAVFECDSCGHEVSGYSKKELLESGWRWEDAKKGRWFVMCGECVFVFERRRKARVDAEYVDYERPTAELPAVRSCSCRPGESCWVCDGRGVE